MKNGQKPHGLCLRHKISEESQKCLAGRDLDKGAQRFSGR
jgi:hypothetical protein